MNQLLCIFQVPKTKSSFCLQSSLYSSLLVSSPPRSGRCCSSVFWVMWVIWIILHLSLKIFWEKPAGWRPQSRTSNKGRPRNTSGSLPQVELENVAGEKNLWHEYMLSQLPTSPNFKSRRKKKEGWSDFMTHESFLELWQTYDRNKDCLWCLNSWESSVALHS